MILIRVLAACVAQREQRDPRCSPPVRDAARAAEPRRGATARSSPSRSSSRSASGATSSATSPRAIAGKVTTIISGHVRRPPRLRARARRSRSVHRCTARRRERPRLRRVGRSKAVDAAARERSGRRRGRGRRQDRRRQPSPLVRTRLRQCRRCTPSPAQLETLAPAASSYFEASRRRRGSTAMQPYYDEVSELGAYDRRLEVLRRDRAGVRLHGASARPRRQDTERLRPRRGERVGAVAG